MNLNYNDLSIEWLGNIAPMDSLNTPQMVAKEVESYLYQMDLEDEDLSNMEAYASTILDAKYEKVDIDDLIEEHCSHLGKVQQNQLKEVLLKYDKLFDGVLKKHPGQPMHIDLQPDASPVYRRPYLIPQIHLATFKKRVRSSSKNWSVVSSQRHRVGSTNLYNT